MLYKDRSLLCVADMNCLPAAHNLGFLQPQKTLIPKKTTSSFNGFLKASSGERPPPNLSTNETDSKASFPLPSVDLLAISGGATSPHTEKPLPPGTGDRGKRDTTAVYWGGIPSMFFDRRNLINNLVMPISPGAYKCQYCTWTLHKMQC